MEKSVNLLAMQRVQGHKVIELGQEIYRHKDGSVTVDYEIKKCTTDGPGHRGCVAVFKILPCGCVRRATWHYLVDKNGECVGAFYDDGEGRYYAYNYECKRHRRAGFHKNA